METPCGTGVTVLPCVDAHEIKIKEWAGNLGQVRRAYLRGHQWYRCAGQR